LGHVVLVYFFAPTVAGKLLAAAAKKVGAGAGSCWSGSVNVRPILFTL